MNKTYPAVSFVAAHGRRLSLALALVALLAGGGGWAWTGSALSVLIAVPAAVALWAALRVAAELVEVVAETLLPR